MRKTLFDTVSHVPGVRPNPQVCIYLNEIGDSWLNFRVVFTLDNYGAQFQDGRSGEYGRDGSAFAEKNSGGHSRDADRDVGGKMRFRWLSFVLLFAGVTLAAELNGVKMPDQVEVGGKQLVLNGLGMRLATFLHVKVYVGALYVEKKSHDANEILNSPEQKQVVLAFVRDVDAGKIRDAWGEGLEKNCKSGCDAFKQPIEKLKSMMIDFKSGDQMAFDFYTDKQTSRFAENRSDRSRRRDSQLCFSGIGSEIRLMTS